MWTREESEKQLVAKALKDPKYRQDLLQDPRSVIAREFGVEIPADISIHVVEETADRLYVVLPPPQASVERELRDEELELVAGGKPRSTAASPPDLIKIKSMKTISE